MLFNSHVFLFAFLPVVFAGFWLLTGMAGGAWARRWIFAASLFFFGWWHPPDLLVLSGSLVGNYVIGGLLFARPPRSAGWLLALGVAGNLLLLGYFKYAKLAVATAYWLAGGSFSVGGIVLPLAISFFTFNQIAYLVDCHRGKGARYSFDDYCLFITFFPHLIAGPIVHHREMMPQLTATRRFDAMMVAQGVTLLVIGLGKKVLLADAVAGYATPVFQQAHLGAAPTLLDAWLGALAYTSQLYFDFSGYSDMAIGLGMMFGIVFPLNFASPYRATNIAEFWRRWHITLSRFLREYLYIPLGGNRRGPTRTSINLMTTMLLGGLWHGAGWTFVAWGGLHGLYLLIHQRFSAAIAGTRIPAALGRGTGLAACWTVTFLGVVFGWVLFRADSFTSAMSLWKGMIGMNGIALPERHVAALAWIGFDGLATGPFILNPTIGMLAWIIGLIGIAVLLPNSQQLVGLAPAEGARPAPPMPAWAGWAEWRPSLPWALGTSCIAVIVVLHLTQVSEFLYFKF